MKIGCVNFYDEAEFIEGCVESLVDKVDRIILVDGAYVRFSHTLPFSTDGTLDIIHRLQAKYGPKIELITCEEAWKDEITKRNTYFKGGEKDHYIVLDADEVLEGSLDGIESHDDWQIRLFRLDGVHPYLVYRIFRHRQGIHYAGAHNALHVGSELMNSEKLPVFEGAKIHHYLDKRSSERKQRKGAYYKDLYEYEQDFRQGNNL